MNRRRFLLGLSVAGGGSAALGRGRAASGSVSRPSSALDRSRTSSFVDLQWRAYADIDDGMDAFTTTYATEDRLYFGGVEDVSESGEPSLDAMVVQTDYEGTVQWRTTFDGDGNDVVSDATWSAPPAVFVGKKTDPSSGTESLWLFELDRDGTVLWEATHPDDEGTPDTKQVITDGYASGYLVATNSIPDGGGESAVRVIRTDDRGSKLWERRLAVDDGRAEYDPEVGVTDDGGYLVASTHRGDDRSSVRFVKLDDGGEIDWRETYDPAQFCEPTDFRPGSGRSLLVVNTYDGYGDPMGARFLTVDDESGIQDDVELPVASLEALSPAPFGCLATSEEGHVVGLDPDGRVLAQGSIPEHQGSILGLSPLPGGGFAFTGRHSTDAGDGDRRALRGFFGRLEVSDPTAVTTTARSTTTERTSTTDDPGTDRTGSTATSTDGSRDPGSTTSESGGSTPSGGPTTGAQVGRADSMLGPLTTYYAFAGLVTVTGLALGAASYHYWLRD